MIYICLIALVVLAFVAGVSFERDRAAGLYSRFPLDDVQPRKKLPRAYQPTKRQLRAWDKERNAIPTTRDTTIRRLVFGDRVRIDITRRN